MTVTTTVSGIPRAKNNQNVLLDVEKSDDMLKKLVAKFSGRNMVAKIDKNASPRFCCMALMFCAATDTSRREFSTSSIRVQLSSNLSELARIALRHSASRTKSGRRDSRPFIPPFPWYEGKK